MNFQIFTSSDKFSSVIQFCRYKSLEIKFNYSLFVSLIYVIHILCYLSHLIIYQAMFLCQLKAYWVQPIIHFLLNLLYRAHTRKYKINLFLFACFTSRKNIITHNSLLECTKITQSNLILLFFWLSKLKPFSQFSSLAWEIVKINRKCEKVEYSKYQYYTLHVYRHVGRALSWRK